MAKDLLSFLQEKPVDEMEYQISIPGRLAKYKFKVKPMNQTQFTKYQQIATTIIPGKNRDVKFNQGRFNQLVIANHVIEPNFKDATLLSNVGVNNAEEYLNKYFLPGEIANLADEICLLSGFDVPDNKLEDEVKNS